MRDFKSLLVSVGFERCSGLDLYAHIVFFLPLHGRHFPFIFAFCVLLTLLLMILFVPIIFFKFLVHLKDIIGSTSIVLANFFCLKNRSVFFLDLGDVWVRSVVTYFQRYTTDIVVTLGFLKWDLSRDITCLSNFFFSVICFISSYHRFFNNFSGFIFKCSDCRAYLL